MPATLSTLLAPLHSRKVRVALVTLLTACLAEWGLHVSDELMNTILALGAALILGIAHEDAGNKSAPPPPPRADAPANPAGSSE